jgi:transcriptional regulator GlxA family with amidase domain
MTRRVERYRETTDPAVRANLGELVGIAELCRIAGIERRTLSRAFRAIHATTPSRYLRAARLNLAREALLVPGDGGKTVTEVATRFGFRELGRFAVEYRATFGESPSETLRRAVPDLPCNPAVARPQADRSD